ncbi:TetR family transcriptional regulator [Naumannella sp. ID2617S]|uniref:TetR family transcriptional regulator n=1 Tax=Enemella dayhoffiae TaxID=2016507 RepID=A0A255HDZ3_9ACTN|nr:TetR/AcrR family transcriptional regulator [Enemella dayhoffiae]NNG20098.1 TetR family transcriptional regulator [Naumannella sp. ID2617S]OYO25303.1 TetR family transcriptional regulator [Enemella dayhoffiae]
MAANPRRRAELVDATLSCLGQGGARALTHRAVDRWAGVPLGTTSNYFATRGDLVLAAAEGIFARLVPDPDRVQGVLDSQQGVAAVEEFVLDVVRRLTASRTLTLALYELRLEAARTPEVAAALNPFLARGREADAKFHQSAGLPGGAYEVQLLHHAINGLVLELLVRGDSLGDVESVVRDLVRRLLRA